MLQNSSVNSLISVIIPIFNAESTLDRCLSSVIRQSLEDLQIICVNEGSTDHSLAIINKYAGTDRRVICINQDNIGVASARNNGLAQATGK